MADCSSRQARGQYKRDHYKTFVFETTRAIGNYVFVECPQLTTTAPDRLAAVSYSKLLPRPFERKRSISLESDADHDIRTGIKNIASISRVIHTAHLDEVTKTNNERNNSKSDHQQKRHFKNSTKIASTLSIIFSDTSRRRRERASSCDGMNMPKTMTPRS